MSKPVRVAFVMEGPTDYVVLRAVVRALLNGRDFEPTVIWPELDENLAARTAGGWGGVYKWCRQAVEQAGGPVRSNPIFAFHDVLVIQTDADVARKKYSDYNITNAPNNDQPCEKRCPPPSATTEALRAVMLGWLGEVTVPPGAVLCTPSKNIETWVLVAIFPNDESARKTNIECRWDGEVRLRKHGLIRSGQKLIEKYQAHQDGIRAAWPDVRGKCSEAERFSPGVSRFGSRNLTQQQQDTQQHFDPFRHAPELVIPTREARNFYGFKPTCKITLAFGL